MYAIRSYYVITASYGFLGLGALLAAINLLLLIFQTVSNRVRIDAKILQIQHVIEMTLIAGLYLLGIGTFLGGIWANESWGRYWGWDPKETWALVTVLVITSYSIHYTKLYELTLMKPYTSYPAIGIAT